MAELLAKTATKFRSFKKGEIIEGTITKLTSGEILVDIGAKTEAVVLEKDKTLLRNLLAKLKVGDKITVSVLNPESDMGYPVVSLRRFMENRVWEKIEKLVEEKQEIEILITGVTKGGFLARADEILGFLPNSQTLFVEEPESLVNQKIKALILEAQRDAHKIIFSQKEAMGSEDFQKTAGSLKAGNKVTATITNIAPFGLFVSVKGGEGAFVEGLIHISEVSWDKIDDLTAAFKVKDKVEAQVIDVDFSEKRLNLSIKRLTADPFEEKTKEYTPDKKFSLTISKISDSGIALELGNGVFGVIKKEKIPPGFEAKEGSEIDVIVSSVDKRRRRVEFVPVLKAKPIGYR